MFAFLKNRIQSFRHAIRGLRDIIKTEHNAWVHGFATMIVLLLCWRFRLDTVRSLIILLFIALVWIAESFNTVLEIVIDIVAPEYSDSAKRAKDIAAAAVLIATIGAVMAGVMIFGPLIF